MPKSRGFTLIELLVVITIIAILSAIGIAAFRNVSTNARDAKRKADIDAIAKAYETKYDADRGVYPVLGDSDFTSGTKPAQPDGSPYPIPSAEVESFQICTPLDAAPPDTTCPVTGHPEYCYCRQSSQGKFVAAGAGTGDNADTGGGDESGGGTGDGGADPVDTAPTCTAVPQLDSTDGILCKTENSTFSEIFINCPTDSNQIWHLNHCLSSTCYDTGFDYWWTSSSGETRGPSAYFLKTPPCNGALYSVQVKYTSSTPPSCPKFIGTSQTCKVWSAAVPVDTIYINCGDLQYSAYNFDCEGADNGRSWVFPSDSGYYTNPSGGSVNALNANTGPGGTNNPPLQSNRIYPNSHVDGAMKSVIVRLHTP